MKKTLLALGLGFSLAAACAFTACGSDSASNALDTEDAVGLGAVSTVRLMGQQLSAQAVKSFAAIGFEEATESQPSAEETEVKSQAEKFNEYFTALDSFLGDDLVTTSTAANTDEKYPYETKMTISGRDVEGNKTEYTMYYTETLVKEKNKNDETESEYTLEGVMVLDGADYFLTGERSFEEDDKETENELNIRAFADRDDKLNYIEMSQETSEEVKNNKTETETEYVYSVYANGKLIEETAVEFETERKANGNEEAEYELEFRKGEAKGKYEIVRETNDNKVEIKVKYAIDGKSGLFRIREKTDENGNKYYEYVFSDGSKLEL